MGAQMSRSRASISSNAPLTLGMVSKISPSSRWKSSETGGSDDSVKADKMCEVAIFDLESSSSVPQTFAGSPECRGP